MKETGSILCGVTVASHDCSDNVGTQIWFTMANEDRVLELADEDEDDVERVRLTSGVSLCLSVCTVHSLSYMLQ